MQPMERKANMDDGDGRAEDGLWNSRNRSMNRMYNRDRIEEMDRMRK